MDIVKKIAKWFGIVIGIAVVGLALFIASDWRFYYRIATFDRMNSMTDIEWHKPSVEIKAGSPEFIPVADPSARTIPEETLAEVAAWAEESESMAMLVWHKGALQLEWYGEGFDETSYMESASMHKSVMALLYGIAIEQGHIESLDEPAATYLPEWADDERSQITIRNMLHMAHGLARASGGFSPLGDNMKLLMGTDWGGIALKSLAEDPPGSIFSYSNLNSQLLGLMLERAVGMPYAEFLEQNLWSKVAESSAWVWLDRPDGLAKTSGSLFTPARNWLRLGLLHLNRGRVGSEQVVPEGWIDEVTTPSPTNPNYGLHTWLGTEYQEKVTYGKGVGAYVPHSEPFLADDVVYFDGANGQRVYVIGSEDLVIVRTGKGSLDFATGAFVWDEPLLPNMVLRGIRGSDTAIP